MKFFMDFGTGSLNKYGEELCGDKVEYCTEPHQFIAVLSDGLGSGVKANILATLTAKIAITMLREGLPIEEVVDTIIHTLPMCSVRKLAYSTFTILKVDDDGMVYIVEFDNPSVFFLRGGKMVSTYPTIREINGRTIKESHFELEEKDTFIFVSDGVIHAGVGMVLNLGWSWKEVAKYLENLPVERVGAKKIVSLLLGVCNDLYIERPGDDTTVVAIQAVKPKVAVLFSGPPKDPEKDEEVIRELISSKGKKIICGGTAANITARVLREKIKTSLDIIDPQVPPIGYINGIDLVTEGVLTLKKAIEKLERIKVSTQLEFLYGEDGASKLATMLYEECTHIHFLVGQAINPAHQNPDFPDALSIKLNVLIKLENILRNLGKIVTITHY